MSANGSTQPVFRAMLMPKSNLVTSMARAGGQSRSAGFQPVSNLLYRRFPIGRTLAHPERISVCRLEALRYSRLETCATRQLTDVVNGPVSMARHGAAT